MNAIDRKALIHQYKETRRPIGVFRVHNIKSGKSLVGTSKDLPSALNSQRAQLRLEAHSNKELQKDWNNLGPEAFIFEILDTLTLPDRQDYKPDSDLKVLESLWLDKLSPFDGRGYNAKSKPVA